MSDCIEFKCWFGDETEADAQDVLMPLDDPSGAAEELVEWGRDATAPDWQDSIDGDPVRVNVKHPRTGKVLVFDVRVVSSIDYYADAVEAPGA
jgi:FKBP-type peptidyl-prolyl cis-trans isomerase 2